MFAEWNQMPEDLQIGLAREALSRAVAMIAEQAEALADEIERGSLTDRGGPNALRLFAAVVRIDGADELAPASGSRLPISGCQFEPLEPERRRDNDRAQRPAPEALCGLPAKLWHKLLQTFARGHVRPEMPGSLGTDPQFQRRTRLPEPQLRRVHPMPVAALAFAQQVKDRRAGPARPISRRVAPGLAVMSALRVRLQFQRLDQRCRRGRGVGVVHGRDRPRRNAVAADVRSARKARR